MSSLSSSLNTKVNARCASLRRAKRSPPYRGDLRPCDQQINQWKQQIKESPVNHQRVGSHEALPTKRYLKDLTAETALN